MYYFNNHKNLISTKNKGKPSTSSVSVARQLLMTTDALFVARTETKSAAAKSKLLITIKTKKSPLTLTFLKECYEEQFTNKNSTSFGLSQVGFNSKKTCINLIRKIITSKNNKLYKKYSFGKNIVFSLRPAPLQNTFSRKKSNNYYTLGNNKQIAGKALLSNPNNNLGFSEKHSQKDILVGKDQSRLVKSSMVPLISNKIHHSFFVKKTKVFLNNVYNALIHNKYKKHLFTCSPYNNRNPARAQIQPSFNPSVVNLSKSQIIFYDKSQTASVVNNYWYTSKKITLPLAMEDHCGLSVSSFREPTNYSPNSREANWRFYSKMKEINLITISLASASRIRQWAEKILPNGKVVGEIINPETVHYKTLKPIKGGLFCERIFGPLKDHECACGKKFNIKNYLAKVIKNTKTIENQLQKRYFCRVCDVEYTYSIIRRTQLGYIQLASPTTHVWFVKGMPSYIAILLDMKKKHLQNVTYNTATLTLENAFRGRQHLPISPKSIFDTWQKIMQKQYPKKYGQKLVTKAKQYFNKKVPRKNKVLPTKKKLLFILKKNFYLRAKSLGLLNHFFKIPSQLVNLVRCISTGNVVTHDKFWDTSNLPSTLYVPTQSFVRPSERFSIFTKHKIKKIINVVFSKNTKSKSFLMRCYNYCKSRSLLTARCYFPSLKFQSTSLRNVITKKKELNIKIFFSRKLFLKGRSVLLNRKPIRPMRGVISPLGDGIRHWLNAKVSAGKDVNSLHHESGKNYALEESLQEFGLKKPLLSSNKNIRYDRSLLPPSGETNHLISLEKKKNKGKLFLSENRLQKYNWNASCHYQLINREQRFLVVDLDQFWFSGIGTRLGIQQKYSWYKLATKFPTTQNNKLFVQTNTNVFISSQNDLQLLISLTTNIAFFATQKESNPFEYFCCANCPSLLTTSVLLTQQKRLHRLCQYSLFLHRVLVSFPARTGIQAKTSTDKVSALANKYYPNLLWTLLCNTFSNNNLYMPKDKDVKYKLKIIKQTNPLFFWLLQKKIGSDSKRKKMRVLCFSEHLLSKIFIKISKKTICFFINYCFFADFDKISKKTIPTNEVKAQKDLDSLTSYAQQELKKIKNIKYFPYQYLYRETMFNNSNINAYRQLTNKLNTSKDATNVVFYVDNRQPLLVQSEQNNYSAKHRQTKQKRFVTHTTKLPVMLLLSYTNHIKFKIQKKIQLFNVFTTKLKTKLIQRLDACYLFNQGLLYKEQIKKISRVSFLLENRFQKSIFKRSCSLEAKARGNNCFLMEPFGTTININQLALTTTSISICSCNLFSKQKADSCNLQNILGQNNLFAKAAIVYNNSYKAYDLFLIFNSEVKLKGNDTQIKHKLSSQITLYYFFLKENTKTIISKLYNQILTDFETIQNIYLKYLFVLKTFFIHQQRLGIVQRGFWKKQQNTFSEEDSINLTVKSLSYKQNDLYRLSAKRFGYKLMINNLGQVISFKNFKFEKCTKNSMINNIYCLSHRELWEQEKDWQDFAYYYYSPTNLTDLPIPQYKHRNFDAFFYSSEREHELLGSTNLSTTLISSQLNSMNINTTFSGAGLIQNLLNEFNYSELKKMDKQNRILLFEYNKHIKTLKKKMNTGLLKSKQAYYKACHARDVLIRRTKLTRRIFNNHNFEYNNSLEEHQLSAFKSNIAQAFTEQLRSKSNINKQNYASKDSTHNKRSDNRPYNNNNIDLREQGIIKQGDTVETNGLNMILTILPVLPPVLRPVLLMSGQFTISDLNRLYQRIIYRNERLKKFLKDQALSSSFEMKYAQRLLQEAVDNLIQNGKSGVVPEKDARGRLLKSLSDILKGKQGRFRQYLLGKRVDYSGRSVIVVGPRLKLQECGIPKEMALVLYSPFLIKRILNEKLADTYLSAKKLIKTNPLLVSQLLREIMKTCPILLNRAPTLHRLGFQAFQPKLVDGKAILLHPLVCPAFNADFDGDQMAVHVPITFEARAEAWKLMLARTNLISPATGDPIILPSQDMVLGCYYLTSLNFAEKLRKIKKDTGKQERQLFDNFCRNKEGYYHSINDVLKAYNQQLIHIHKIIWVRIKAQVENVNTLEQPLEIRIPLTQFKLNKKQQMSLTSFNLEHLNISQKEQQKDTDSPSTGRQLPSHTYSPQVDIEKKPMRTDYLHFSAILKDKGGQLTAVKAVATNSIICINYIEIYSKIHNIINLQGTPTNHIVRTTPGKILFNLTIKKAIEKRPILLSKYCYKVGLIKNKLINNFK